MIKDLILITNTYPIILTENYSHIFSHRVIKSMTAFIFLSFSFHNHAWSKTERNKLMEKGCHKGIDLYCRDITNHHHCKYSPCTLLLDHNNLQNFMLCTFHAKASPTVTPLAPCQTSLQRNLEKCVHDNLQMRP